MIVAPARLGLIRAGLVLGGGAVLLVELLSAFGLLYRGIIIALWALVAVAAAWFGRHRARAIAARVPAFWRDAGRGERVMVAMLVSLFLAELVVALRSPPNNFDSQTYHLPKIEHWVAQGDVGFYPTVIDRQLAMAPGAEYLLLHLRLLTGGDALYNLVQLAAGAGGAIIASRIAAQLGGARRAQLIAALIFGTTPIVVLEATSTQTDLVVALWVGSVATLVLDELHRRTPWTAALLLGVAAGLVLLTKATGLLAAGPMLIWWFATQVRRRPVVVRALAGAAIVAALMAVISGPYLWRVQSTYGHPLGPAHLRDSISMQRHDPASVLINALRIAETALETPAGAVGSAQIIDLAHALGVDPQARDITYWGAEYPYESWPPDEDRVSLPVQGALVLIGAFVLLWRRSPARLYAALFWFAVLAYVVTVKWQPWGNRLVVFLVLLGTPLGALWVDSLLASRRRVLNWAVVLVLAGGAVAGGASVAFGWPRRLVGPHSVFTMSRADERFVRRPEWGRDYQWAAAQVRASGARRVGLLQGYNTWEYPWWILLRGDELVSLQSLQPDLKAAGIDTVDAVVCVDPPISCAFYIPPSWNPQTQGSVTYAIHPPR
ncbi:glycosyltransferase family 39 protein [Dactylosporangium sp. CA-139066]|uniref:glycosyltransferase family 39 protein n=1 Tax=Dactylosporangium sp. CA-139066 TaxID=3239930 RepID=UPI003D91D0A7